MTHIAQITKLIETLAQASGKKVTTISRYVAGNGDFYTRLKRGHDITTRRAASVVQKISDRWPVDLAWPDDIPRPEPSPGSPASREAA